MTAETARSSKNRKIGLILSYASFIAQICVSFAFTPFVLEMLGDREYGLYTFVNSITTWLNTFLLAAVSGYHKFLKEESVKDPVEGEQRASAVFFKIFALIALVIVVLGISVFILFRTSVIPLDTYTESEKSSIYAIMIASFLLLAFNTFVTCFKSYVYFRQSFIFVYSFSLLSIGLSTLISYFVLRNGGGVVGYAFTQFGVAALFSVIHSCFSIFFLKQRLKLKHISEQEKAAQRALAKQIAIFSSFVILSTVANTLNSNMDSTILGFINPTMVTMNGLAIHLSGYVASLSTIIGTIFNQKFNDVYFEEEGKRKSNELFLRISNYQLLLVFLIIGGFVACGREFILLWLDEEHMQVFYIAIISMIIGSVAASTTVSSYSRIIQSVHKKAAIISLIAALVNLGLSIALVFIMGFEVAIWACLIGTVVSTVGSQWIVFTIYDTKVTGLPMKRYWLMYLKALLIAGVISGSIFLLFDYAIDLSALSVIVRFLIKGGIFVALYAVALFLFYRGTIKEIISYLPKRKKKQASAG